MIVFDPTFDTFRFVHLSVKKFLKKRSEYIKKTTSALIVETCLLNVLNAADNSITKKILFKYEQDSLNSILSYDFKNYSTVY